MTLDLDAIEARWKAQMETRGITRDGQRIFNEDVPALIAEVRRLEAALADAAEAHNKVFNLWEEASGEATNATKAERNRCLGIIESRMHTTDETDEGAELWSELDTLRQQIESKEYGA